MKCNWVLNIRQSGGRASPMVKHDDLGWLVRLVNRGGVNGRDWRDCSIHRYPPLNISTESKKYVRS